MKKRNLSRSFFLSAMVFAFVAFAKPLIAQMHRPILDDVFTLYNYLHRDYSQADEPQLRQERIESDRSAVISILSTYIGEDQWKMKMGILNAPQVLSETDRSGIEKLRIDFDKLKQLPQDTSTRNLTSNTTLSTYFKDSSDTKKALKSNLYSLQEELYKSKKKLTPKLGKEEQKALAFVDSMISEIARMCPYEDFVLQVERIVKEEPWTVSFPLPQYQKSLMPNGELAKLGLKNAKSYLQQIRALESLRTRLGVHKKAIEREIAAFMPTDKNEGKLSKLQSGLYSVDVLIAMSNEVLSGIKWDADSIRFGALENSFSDEDKIYRNPLLESLVKRFSEKYASVDLNAESTSSEIVSSGQKAAFGLPGIAASAPMMVDVLNEVLMEEIKAELANAVFKVLQERLSDSERKLVAKDSLCMGGIEELVVAKNSKVEFHNLCSVSLDNGEWKVTSQKHSLYVTSHRKSKPDSSFILPKDHVVNLSCTSLEIGDNKIVQEEDGFWKVDTKLFQRIQIVSGGAVLRRTVPPAFRILAALFPKTKQFLTDIATIDISRATDLLKENIRTDLQNLLPNLAKLDDNVPWVAEMKYQYPEVRAAFAGIELMDQLSEIRHPVEIFGLLPESDAFKLVGDNIEVKTKEVAARNNMNAAARMMELFAYSLTLEENGTRAWVNMEVLDKYLNEADFYRLYFGCLLGLDNKYDSYRIAVFEEGDTKGTRIIPEIAKKVVLKTKDEEFKHLRAVFFKVSQAGNYVNDQVLSLKQMRAKGQKPTAQDVEAFALATAGIIDTTLWSLEALTREFLPDTKVGPKGRSADLIIKEATQKIRKTTDALRKTTAIYHALSEKQYVLAIGNSMQLLRSMTCEIDSDSKLCSLFDSGDWERTANLLVSIAVAENRDDLESAIRQFAHNPGSWRVKRESAFNISLGVYGGGLFGMNFGRGKKDSTVVVQDSAGVITNQKIDSTDTRARATGAFSLSVGPNISIGLCKGKYPNSLSLFVPIIDIGTVTAFRFRAGSAVALPNFEWKDIFAPGAFVYYGLPKVPISLGFGFQRSPSLSKITHEPKLGVTRTYFASAWRLGATVAVDLSLLNFKTKLFEPVKKSKSDKKSN